MKPDFALIETMRYTPGEGVVRLDLHLQRLEASAKALGFPESLKADTALRDYLGSLEKECEEMRRVRLELDPDGRISISSARFALQGDETVWKIAIAKTRISSNDPLVRHKTTRRTVYDAARAEYPQQEIQEVLLLNGNGELAEGTITNVFVDDGSGVLLTPPVSTGCLAGVLRRELLDTGRAREVRLRPEELVEHRLYVGNSLRGLIRAQIGK